MASTEHNSSKPNQSAEELVKKLEKNPQIAKLVKNVADQKSKLAGGSANSEGRARQKDEQELAPGNPRSLEQMEKLNPRKDGEDEVAYLDRIFG